MSILNLESVSKTYGEKKILDNVSCAIDDGEHIGVVGINGAGKSTLLSVVAGIVESDSGEIIKRRDLRISFLSQSPRFNDSLSILDNVASGIQGKEAHWDTEGEAKALLKRFGIADPEILPGRLSGGQKKRAALIAALLTPCELLILDEPTNHLDHEMIEWLEERLLNYKGALLMVTHDRYFLDAVTDKIWELDRASLYSYDENYSGYLELKQERLDYAKAAERKMAALYKQDLKWILRGARARSTKQKAHIRRFEALRDREKIVEERQAVISSMSSRLGRTIIEIEHISKAYGENELFRDFTYTFTRTDRIGIIGSNGCGKSTLLKILLGPEKPDTGSVAVGQTVNFGYFSQENEALDETERVIDCVKNVAEYVRTQEGLISASAMCERFLFDSKMQYTPVSLLSGGEKRRLYLLKVLMGSPNVLILDEPTNDLDIQTLQILEDYLDTFNGVIIAVSHDRYFLDRVVSRIFSFEPDKHIYQSEGAYTEYLEHKQGPDSNLPVEKPVSGIRATQNVSADGPAAGSSFAGSGRAVTGAGSSSAALSSTVPAGKTARTGHTGKKLSYNEQREYEGLEALIDALTEKCDSLDREILEVASDYTKLSRLTEEKEQTEKELEAKIGRFVELEEKIASFAQE